MNDEITKVRPFVLDFEHSDFDIVSDFGFRYSDFMSRFDGNGMCYWQNGWQSSGDSILQVPSDFSAGLWKGAIRGWCRPCDLHGAS